jgi:hypothetical protein
MPQKLKLTNGFTYIRYISAVCNDGPFHYLHLYVVLLCLQ